MAKRSREIMREFGIDALKALKNKGTWEGEPESVEMGTAFAYPCDSNTCPYHWHMHHLIPGFRTEGGHVYEVIHECDQDGNWEFLDEHDVDADDYEEWRKDYSWDAAEKTWREYAQFVARTGSDELGQYLVQRKCKVKCRMTLARLPAGQIVFVCGMHGDKIIDDHRSLPKSMRYYLRLKRDRLRDFTSEGSVSSFVAKLDPTMIVSHDHNMVTIEVELDEKRRRRAIVADLKRVAQKHLDDNDIRIPDF